MTKKQAIRLDAFEVSLADIDTVPLEHLHALSIGVGWPHRAKDWQVLLDLGEGVVTVDKIGRVLGSAMWFPFGKEFASLGMVITTPRLQALGAGRRLMDYALERNSDRMLGLNATAEALRLYISLGFQLKATVNQRQGIAVTPAEFTLPPGANLRAVDHKDLAELSALDQLAYGADRHTLFARILPISNGVALLRDGRIQAFSLCRRFGRGCVVGPIVASNDDDAIAVVRPQVIKNVGRFLRIDTRHLDGAFADFLDAVGLRVYDAPNSMWKGRPWPITREDVGSLAPITYGLASHTLG